MDKEELIGRLYEFGLQAYEVQLLLSRFYDGMSFKDIVDQHKWTSVGSASYHFKMALKKLREGKFSLR